MRALHHGRNPASRDLVTALQQLTEHQELEKLTDHNALLKLTGHLKNQWPGKVWLDGWEAEAWPIKK